MSKQPYRTCRQLTTEGRLCQSPALKGKMFCYYHQRDQQRRELLSARAIRRLTRLTPDLLDALQLPSPDDPASLRVWIHALMRGILSGLIKREEAAQVTYLIQLATVNNLHAGRLEPDPEVACELRTIVDPDPIAPPTNQIADPEEAQRAAHRNAVFQNGMEVVKVRPRSGFGTVLAPTAGFEQADLDEIDILRTQPPEPKEDEEESYENEEGSEVEAVGSH
jgi:hypothetical protein